MKIATVNVNGIRAAARKGIGEWIEAATPDVILMQEVRAPEELVAPIIGETYETHVFASILKGRAGVAVAVKRGFEITDVRRGIEDSDGDEPGVDSGRWLEVDVPELGLTLVSAYLHSGDAKRDEKMAAKYAHLDRVTARLGELKANRGGDLTDLLVAGDFNIVHTPLDITNWKSNHNKTSGVLDPEIAYMDRWLNDLGFVDVQRLLTGEAQGPYTWWSQRGQAFDKNVGWRIDYQMVNPAFAARAQNFEISRASSYDTRWSDHAPLLVTYR